LQRTIAALDHHIESSDLIWVTQLETVRLPHLAPSRVEELR
jgi:hypothetical protein